MEKEKLRVRIRRIERFETRTKSENLKVKTYEGRTAFVCFTGFDLFLWAGCLLDYGG